MSRIPRPEHFFAAGLVAALASTGCSSDRTSFVDDNSNFSSPDAAPPPSCGLTCTLDHRSVVDTCTGAVVETCAQNRACGAGVCQEPCAAAAADNSSNGCDFYLQPPAYRHGELCFAAYVVNTSTLPVDLTLSLGADPIDLSKAVYHADPNDPTAVVRHEGPVLPGDTVIVYLSDRELYNLGDDSEAMGAMCPYGVIPATFVEYVPTTTGRGKSFHLTTNAPVGLTSIYPAAGGASRTTTATLLLPVPLWGKENMIVNAWSVSTNGVAPGYGPTTQIVASKDDTEVTVYPKHAIQGGPDVVGTAEGIPVTYQLNRGEVLQFDQIEELTGSVVVSNHPISIFGGHHCALIPSDTMACDYAQQQLPALAQWGSEYAALGNRPRREGNEAEPMPYRIVAARDGTKLDYDPPLPPPGAPLELAAGEVAAFFTGVGEPFVVRTQDAEHPIYVAAYMTGADAVDNSTVGASGIGDAEFVNVVPAQQYQSAYSFYADPTYADTSLAILRRKTNGAFKDVWLECAGILSDWKPVGVRGEYEWRRVELARRFGKADSFDDTTCGPGLQRMRSDGEFTATVWGWDFYVSYAYPGGTALRNMTTGSFAPVR